MRYFRRILGITWKHRVTNETVIENYGPYWKLRTPNWSSQKTEAAMVRPWHPTIRNPCTHNNAWACWRTEGKRPTQTHLAGWHQQMDWPIHCEQHKGSRKSRNLVKEVVEIKVLQWLTGHRNDMTWQYRRAAHFQPQVNFWHLLPISLSSLFLFLQNRGCMHTPLHSLGSVPVCEAVYVCACKVVLEAKAKTKKTPTNWKFLVWSVFKEIPFTF